MSTAEYSNFTYFTSTNSVDTELNSILNFAYQNSDIVRQAIQQAYDNNYQIYTNQNSLLQENSELLLLSPNQIDLSLLQAQTLARIDHDLNYVNKLNNAVSNYKALGVTDINWPLASNKMQEVLLGAREIVNDDGFFSAITQGVLPENVSNLPLNPVILGDTTRLYGNSQITYLSAAILEVNLTLQGENAHIQDVDHSAIVHVTSIPDSIDLNQVDASFVDNCSFYFSDAITPQGFIFVHSGFAFGGHRFEERYPEGKEFGPEDASSWIAKLSNADFLFSTIDELYTYQMSLPEEKRDIEPNWLISDGVKTMQALDPVEIMDPTQDIHPGQVFAFRDFEGDYGYTSLVLGLRENGNLITLGYARGMPDTEGFGIVEFPLEASKSQQIMFFDIKDVLGTNDAIPGLDSLSANSENSVNVTVNVSVDVAIPLFIDPLQMLTQQVFIEA